MALSTHSLVVERHHLAADVPERLGDVIGWVHSCSFGVNSAHLPLIVSVKGGLGSTVLDVNIGVWIWILCVFQSYFFLSDSIKSTFSEPHLKRILHKFNSSFGNHCLPFGLHERRDDVTLVFLCDGGEGCDEDLHTSHRFWFVHLYFFSWGHTSGIVKRDEFIGLNVVDQGGHRLIRCHLLSGCALCAGSGQEVTGCPNCLIWTRTMGSSFYLIGCFHFLLILLLCVLLLLIVLRRCLHF